LVEPGQNSGFWAAVDAGLWEPETFAIFDELIRPDSLVLDVGAWIGATALYAAQKSRLTVAFEPDPLAFPVLRDNVATNAKAAWADRLEIVNKAVNADGHDVSLGSRGAGGDSMSSILFSSCDTSWRVQGASIYDIVDYYGKSGQPIFLKIDIEGGEYDLIPKIPDVLSDLRVSAMISLHPSFLRSSCKHTHGNQWRGAFGAAHAALIDALPRNKSVTFGRSGSRNRVLAKLRARLTGSFSRSILIR